MFVRRALVVGAVSFSCNCRSGPQGRGCLDALGQVHIIFIGWSLESIDLDTRSRKEAELQVVSTYFFPHLERAGDDFGFVNLLSSLKPHSLVRHDLIGGELCVPLLHSDDIIALRGIFVIREITV